MQATWTNVIRECLKGDGKGANLQNALEAFTNSLKLAPDSDKYGKRYLLGEGGTGDYPCNGIDQVCVMYYNESDTAKHKHPMPWWKYLADSLKTEEEKEKQKKQEEEKQKNNEKNKQKEQNQERSQPQHTPRTAALKSTKQDSTEAEQINPENISNTISTIDETSGTIITQPFPWLLSAIFLI